MSNKVINVPERARYEEAIIFEGGGRVEVVVDREGQICLVFVIVGEGEVECSVDLAAAGAECDIHALWLATDTARTGLNIRINHSAHDCRSFQLVKGIASDAATGTFTGEIYVAPDAQRTIALQQSHNLLLGEDARIITQPQLEIYADDVKCSHGATVGQMDAAEIFYMRQRGLSDSQARLLQIQGFANDILSRIDDPATRERAERLVRERL